MGILGNFKMSSGFTFLIGCLAVVGAVTPLTPEELQQIRDFTAKAHMKRLQSYPDQLMTPTTHYMGRRIPPNEKQPTIFMQAPTAQTASIVKPTQTFTVEQQQAGAVQNYLLNYPIATTNSLNHQQQAIHQFQRPQPAFPYLNVQNAPNGPLRGPPPQFGRRPSFLNLPESAPSIFNFFFPKRPARRPSFRPPLRFEYAQAASQNPALLQHQQNLHNVMAQQHLFTLQQQQQNQQQQQQQQQQQNQQQQQAQQSVIRPSTAPSTQSTTIKNSQVTPTITTVVTASTPTHQQYNYQNHAQLVPLNAPPLVNQFHRDISFFGKPIGKHAHHHPKYQTVTPAFVPQNRPGDEQNYIQKYVSPQPDFSFLPIGAHVPPVIAGPTSNRFNSPVSFTHIEQMPFAMQQSPPLPMHMVVQSQEFPNYHFSTTFTASGTDNNIPSSSTPAAAPVATSEETTIKPFESHAGSAQSSSTRQTHRIKKIRTRPTSTISTSTLPPSTTQSLGDVIFESSKETREFHDSARIPSSVNGNNDFLKVRKNKSSQSQKESHDETQQKASAESSNVVLAPLVFTEESSEPYSPTTTSPRPTTTTTKSIPSIRSTTTTTTQEPSPSYKPKFVKSKPTDFHKSKNIHHHNYDKRVTASGAGLSAVTVEPYRSTSTGSSKSTGSPGGRVVTTSVTSRVVSIGPQNPQKRYRLRKVKVPNPDLKKTTTSISTSASSSTSTSSSPTTTPISTSVPSRSTTTSSSISSTEGSSTTTA